MAVQIDCEELRRELRGTREKMIAIGQAEAEARQAMHAAHEARCDRLEQDIKSLLNGQTLAHENFAYETVKQVNRLVWICFVLALLMIAAYAVIAVLLKR